MALMLRKIEDKGEGWQDSWIASLNSTDMNLSKFCMIVEDRGTWYVVVHDITKSQTWAWITEATAMTTNIYGEGQKPGLQIPNQLGFVYNLWNLF